MNCELYRRLQQFPLENGERVEYVYDRLADMANKLNLPAPRRDAVCYKGHPERYPNIIATIPGSTGAVIVVGAHHDKSDYGEGKVDDGSGCVIALQLYKSLGSLWGKQPGNHTLVFALFAHEEDGLRGSHSYVQQLESGHKLDEVKAMVNLECLGVSKDRLWIFKRGSTDRMIELAKTVADEKYHVEVRDKLVGGADSIPFKNAGIESITIDGIPLEDMNKIDTVFDTMKLIHRKGLGLAYRFLGQYMVALDSALPQWKRETALELSTPIPEEPDTHTGSYLEQVLDSKKYALQDTRD